MKKKSVKRGIGKKAHRLKSTSWYSKWHEHPYHGYVHWGIFIVVAVTSFVLIRSSASAVYDLVNPNVVVTYPVNKVIIKPNTSLTVTAKATDDIGISHVMISIMRWNKASGNTGTISSLKQCDDYIAPYTCDFTVPSERNVEYMVQAVAYDTSNNFTISKYVQFPVK